MKVIYTKSFVKDLDKAIRFYHKCDLDNSRKEKPPLIQTQPLTEDLEDEIELIKKLLIIFPKIGKV